MKRVIFFIIIVIILIPISIIGFKYANLTIWEVELIGDVTSNTIVTYNDESYYDIDMWQWETEENRTFDMSSYKISHNYIKSLDFFSWSKNPWDVLVAERMYFFENDKEKNFICVINNSVFGPSRFIYVKEDFNVPTINTSEISAIYITNNPYGIDIENPQKIDSTIYDDIYICLKNQKDFQQFLGETEWTMIYVQYKNYPLMQRIAKNQNDTVVWD